MDNGTDNLLWLQDEVPGFDFSEDDNLDFAGTGFVDPAVSLTTASINIDPPLSVNPAELQRTQGTVTHRPNEAGGRSVIAQSTLSRAPPVLGNDANLAMDDFLRSQGGWRPPVPCSHCRRLRLQCFMLQTTSVNPNPVTSCSSCVALYRQCSLAGPAKREASQFETPQPVIGQLHGVYEDEHVGSSASNHAGPVHSSSPSKLERGRLTKASKRTSSRSNTGTRPLRMWFDSNFANPYPSESDKERLAHDSGLSRTQVDNWFSNARRRKKHSEQATSAASRAIYRQGSPMPTSTLAEMTPLERWKHSPPDAEPAQFIDIERCIGLSSTSSSFDALQQASNYDLAFMPTPEFDPDADWLSLPGSVNSSSNATSSCNSQTSYGAHSSSSKRSFGDAGLDTLPPKRRQRSKQSSFNCPECARKFTRRSDLLRHEKAIHRQSAESWICSDLILPGESASVWRISRPEPECALCGQLNPDEKHFVSHEFVACADRAISERTFSRKDHLWQHLYKFHRCRKWDGWTLDQNVERLRHVSTG